LHGNAVDDQLNGGDGIRNRVQCFQATTIRRGGGGHPAMQRNGILGSDIIDALRLQ